MRHAGNFNPEWGYIAPAPNFLRTTRLFVVAAAIGATASAAVVFSLMDRPAAETVAARTLVRPAEPALPARNAALVAQLQTQSEPASVSQTQRADAPSAMRPQGAAVAAHAISPVASEFGRCVDDAKPTHRCRIGRVSKDHDDGSAARTCAAD